MTEISVATGSAFDPVAADYDRREAVNPVMQMMRSRSLAALAANFPPGSRLLDVGCGTGIEAIWLTERGRSIVAVDSSPQMLEVLSHQAGAAGLGHPPKAQLMGPQGNPGLEKLCRRRCGA